MSTWQDIVSSQPRDGQLVLARRVPRASPPFTATWDAGAAQRLCGLKRWAIPWQFVSYPRPMSTAPAWP